METIISLTFLAVVNAMRFQRQCCNHELIPGTCCFCTDCKILLDFSRQNVASRDGSGSYDTHVELIL